MSVALNVVTAAALLSATLAPFGPALAAKDKKAVPVEVDEVRLEPMAQTIPVLGRLVARLPRRSILAGRGRDATRN